MFKCQVPAHDSESAADFALAVCGSASATAEKVRASLLTAFMAILLEEITGRRRRVKSGDGAMCAYFNTRATRAITAEFATREIVCRHSRAPQQADRLLVRFPPITAVTTHLRAFMGSGSCAIVEVCA